MKKQYNVGYFTSRSDEYLDDVKQAMIDKGLADENTPASEFGKILKNEKFITEMLEVNPTFVISLIIQLNSATTVSNYTVGTNSWLTDELLEEFVPYLNKYLPKIPFGTRYIFSGFEKVTKIPKNFDWSVITNWVALFKNSKKLKEIKFDPLIQMTTQFQQTFYYCAELETLEGLDLINISYINDPFTNCKRLTNLKLYNIKESLQIGSGKSYGHLLTVESLIHTCKECVKPSGSRTLTMGNTNKNKLTNVYVKFTDPSQTTIATGEKGDVVDCESTDEGAMTITEYMALKNWTLA